MAGRTILINGSYAPSLVNFRGPLICALVAQGHRIHASAPDLVGAQADAVRALGAEPHDVPLARTGLNPLADLRYATAIRRLIRDCSIDYVLGYTIKPCIWGSLAAGMSGVPSASLVTGLGLAFMPASGFKQKAVQAVSRRLWRMATARNKVVIFQNPDDRQDFVASGALADPGKTRLVDGSGVDMAHFARAPLPTEPVFLMISRLLGNKGVREYAEAAVRLLDRGVKARFLLAGFHDDSLDAVTPPEVAAWEAKGLEYLGPLDDVRPTLARCSVYVLPSYREGTPRTVLEAMAMGRPVITTDAPGCRETVRHGENGLLVPVGDIDATAEVMLQLATDGDMRAEMGARGFVMCAGRYAVERVNAAMIAHLGL